MKSFGASLWCQFTQSISRFDCILDWCFLFGLVWSRSTFKVVAWLEKKVQTLSYFLIKILDLGISAPNLRSSLGHLWMENWLLTTQVRPVKNQKPHLASNLTCRLLKQPAFTLDFHLWKLKNLVSKSVEEMVYNECICLP